MRLSFICVKIRNKLFVVDEYERPPMQDNDVLSLTQITISILLKLSYQNSLSILFPRCKISPC